MKRTTLGRASVPAALALALTLSACGAANEPDSSAPGGDGETGNGDAVAADVSGSISGVGASSQAAAIDAWKAQFEGANPDATVNYDPQGSGAGREQFLAGATDFAGSDAYLDEEELGNVPSQCGELIELPAYISPIAVAYNLEGVDEINMSAATLAGVFNGSITTWNAPEIAAENEGVELPNTPITPVHRSDKSGTTENFTEYLHKAAPDVWTDEPAGDFPISGGEAAQGTSGVVQAIQAGDGAIGYADASQIGELPSVKVKSGDEYVEYSPEAAAAVVDSSEPAEGDRPEYSYAIDLNRDPQDGEYPIVLVAYTMACSTYADEGKAELMKAWLTYMVSEEGQNVAAEAAGSAPISSTLRDNAMTAIDQISAG
ncbi:MAG: phosphate ABC transporter substrate-binding protein PstS [Mobilicoccus sp.]|nr:phosphate ABC transporter substrate-binding protein PstS [Mobilicoccus sp.]